MDNCLERCGPAGRPVWPIQSAAMARRRGRGIIQCRLCGEIGARSGLCALDWTEVIGMGAWEVCGARAVPTRPKTDWMRSLDTLLYF